VSTHGFCRVWPDPSVPISGCAFQVLHLLLRPAEVGEDWRYDRLHSFRYKERSAGTKGNEVTHLAEGGAKVLDEYEEPVMVGELSREIRMR